MPSTPVFDTSTALEVEFSPTAVQETLDLVEFAFGYDQVMYCYELADRGRFEVRYDPLEERTLYYYAAEDKPRAISEDRFLSLTTHIFACWGTNGDLVSSRLRRTDLTSPEWHDADKHRVEG